MTSKRKRDLLSAAFVAVFSLFCVSSESDNILRYRYPYLAPICFAGSVLIVFALYALRRGERG